MGYSRMFINLLKGAAKNFSSGFNDAYKPEDRHKDVKEFKDMISYHMEEAEKINNKEDN